MIKFDKAAEKKKFQDYIFMAWDSSKHNFSVDEDGYYVYRYMQMAWEVWVYAKEESQIETENAFKKEQLKVVNK